MDIFITLDYELFFGDKTGNVDDCLIEPTEELLKIVDPFDIKLVFFVDVGYIIKLKEFKSHHKELQKDYEKVTRQLKMLSRQGHSIQLHIHPHWENSYYKNSNWVLDHSRYKLSDYCKNEVSQIIVKYHDTLFNLTGKKPKVFRAGGWSAQPFEHIKEGLLKCDISTDSTAFAKGFYSSNFQSYDFRSLKPYQPVYNFDSDPNSIQADGRFIEYPISSIKLNPSFYWKFAFRKLLKKKKHQSYGKGSAIRKSKLGLTRLLFLPSYSVVSIDGYKSSLLEKSFNKYLNNDSPEHAFVIIGHPKAFSPYSLCQTKKFINKYHNGHNFKAF